MPPGRTLAWGQRTHVMGVLNLTPDSFSDGGRLTSPQAAVAAARRMARQGAAVLDLGGQSTRPGASEVEPEEELRRVLPSLRAIRSSFSEPAFEGAPAPPLLSIDTFRASVAAAALEAGADWINDVSGGARDPDLLPLIAAAGCPYVLMHNRGTSATMDGLAVYGDVVTEVHTELLRATDRALAAGLAAGQIIWDPGLGFAKTTAHNLALLEGLSAMRAEGFPLLVGPSRKRFIGELLGEPRPRARLWGTAAVVCRLVAAGADLVRVHDVGAIVQTCRMADALWR
ncbi:dihydropteroate synthase [Cyanobium sp. ATX 6F1]|uniref:dihydropteroate synthase n=1 Tax=unclassified Cyanobium TaxID=2627006 RepID=UPI0020CBE4DE|nr:dihydropteroate synthase [Cyanobium sp. ATX 6F1]MCP9917601.1 dihydropteroate synthase [Cyanobium sp. ATX 6F1]